MDRARFIAMLRKILSAVTISSGVFAFVLQWLIVREQTSSSSEGRIIKVLTLGQYGVYAPYWLGISYYVVSGIFIIGLLAMITIQISARVKRR